MEQVLLKMLKIYHVFSLDCLLVTAVAVANRRLHSKNVSNYVLKSTVNSHLGVISHIQPGMQGGDEWTWRNFSNYNLQHKKLKEILYPKLTQILHRSTVSDPFYCSLLKCRFFLAVCFPKLQIMIRDAKLGCPAMKLAMWEGDWTDKQYLL